MKIRLGKDLIKKTKRCNDCQIDLSHLMVHEYIHWMRKRKRILGCWRCYCCCEGCDELIGKGRPSDKYFCESCEYIFCSDCFNRGANFCIECECDS